LRRKGAAPRSIASRDSGSAVAAAGSGEFIDDSGFAFERRHRKAVAPSCPVD
jgi:hypothetical protein